MLFALHWQPIADTVFYGCANRLYVAEPFLFSRQYQLNTARSILTCAEKIMVFNVSKVYVKFLSVKQQSYD